MMKKILLIFIVVVFSILFLEGIVRFLHLNDIFSKKNCKYYYDNINSLQFRDIEHKLDKAKDIYRVLILGDSFAYGVGVPFNNIFPRLVEKKWNKMHPSSRIEVINCARPGWNTEKEISFCFDTFLPYKPDLIIISYVLNDTECLMHNKNITLKYWQELSFHEPKSKIVRFIFKKSELFRYLFNRIENTRIRREFFRIKKELYKDENVCYGYFKKAVEDLAIAKKKNGFDVLVIIFPYFNMSLQDYPFLDLHRQVSSIFREAGCDVIDLYDYYKIYKSEQLKVCAADAHPNVLANDIAADVILRYLQQKRKQ